MIRALITDAAFAVYAAVIGVLILRGQSRRHQARKRREALDTARARAAARTLAGRRRATEDALARRLEQGTLLREAPRPAPACPPPPGHPEVLGWEPESVTEWIGVFERDLWPDGAP